MTSSNMDLADWKTMGSATLRGLQICLSFSLMCHDGLVKCSSPDKCGTKPRFNLEESILVHLIGSQGSRFLKGGSRFSGIWHGGIGRCSSAKLCKLSRGGGFESWEGSDPYSWVGKVSSTWFVSSQPEWLSSISHPRWAKQKMNRSLSVIAW